MKKVNILASESSLFSTIYGPVDMLTQAGVFWNRIKKLEYQPVFDVSISTVDGRSLTNFMNLTLQPHKSISTDDTYDIIIVPSEGFTISRESESYIKRVKYIKEQFTQGALVTSICTGAFLLADAGILNGKKATTHWAFAEEFKKNFPKVKLDTNLSIADSGDVITSGGFSSDLHLTMHLIKKIAGNKVALQSSSCTLVDVNSPAQSNYMSFMCEKNHGDASILECQEHIEESLAQPLNITELSKQFGMSLSSFNRRFKLATGFSSVQYIQELRVNRAKELLNSSDFSFEHIANEVGYENVSFFRKTFKKIVKLTPKEYRKKFYIVS